MNVTALELIVFCVTTLFTRCTGVIRSSAFIGSCKTTLTFKISAKSLILNYNGAVLYDVLGQPCEPVVQVKHYDVSYPRIKMCVKFHSGYEACRRAFRFYFANKPDKYYSCEHIQREAVCKPCDTVIAEFRPWNKTETYTGDIKIDVYIQDNPISNYKPSTRNEAWFLVILISCIVVVLVIVIIAVRQQKMARNKRQQTIDQPQLQPNGIQGFQYLEYSAEPPKYSDVMAPNNMVTLNPANMERPQGSHRSHEVILLPYAPPLFCENAPLVPPGNTPHENIPPPYCGAVPTEQPPPYS